MKRLAAQAMHAFIALAASVALGWLAAQGF